MYNQTERAAFMTLLARARENDVPLNAELETILGRELFGEYQARWSRIYESEEAEADAVDNRDTMTVSIYRDRVNMIRRQYESMSNRLPKLLEQEQALLLRIKSHQDFLASAKADAWAHYEALDDEEKDFAAPGTEEDGWPPKFFDTAPPKVIFRRMGKHTPYARALVRVLSRALGLNDEVIGDEA